MNVAEFGLFLFALVTGVTGQFLLKAGALQLGKVNASNFISHLIGIVTTPQLLIGLAFYGIGAFAYILLLTRVQLSIVGPAVALSYVFSVLIGYFVFNEAIPISRALGVGLIMCGVVLVMWKN